MTRSMGRARLVDGHSAKPPVAPRAQPSMETNRRRLPPRELPPPDPFLKPAPAVTTNRRQAPPAKSHDAIGGPSQTGRRSQRNANCRARSPASDGDPIAEAFRRASFRDPIRSSSPLRPCEQITDHRHRSSPMTRSMGRARLVDGHSAKPPVAPRAQPSMETNRRRLPPRELPPPDPFLKPAPAVTTNRRQAPPAKSHDAIGGSSQTGRRSQRNATCRAKGQPSMETNRRRLPPRELPRPDPFLKPAPAMRTNR
jgi:hypothetical protein